MSCINCARIVPWHDRWHREMTNQQTVPVPFPIGGWHWHSDAKKWPNKLPVKIRKNEWTQPSNNVQAKPIARQRRAAPRLHVRLHEAMLGGWPDSEGYLAILLLGLFLYLR
jgi:hypothetical protein